MKHEREDDPRDHRDGADDEDGVEELAARVHATDEDAMRSAIEFLERDNDPDDDQTVTLP